MNLRTSHSARRRAAATLTFDDSDFRRDLGRLDTKYKAAALRGLGKTALAHMHDILHVAPVAPEDTSALRSGISVFSGRRLIATSADQRNPTRNPKDYLLKENPMPPRDPNMLESSVIVNAPYAAFQQLYYHFGFVFAKLTKYADKYIRIIADEMKKVR